MNYACLSFHLSLRSQTEGRTDRHGDSSIHPYVVRDQNIPFEFGEYFENNILVIPHTK